MKSLLGVSRAVLWIARIVTICQLAVLSGCAEQSSGSLDSLADSFVHIGLRFQNHDRANYLYTGPEQWRQEAKEDPILLIDLLKQLDELTAQLAAINVEQPELNRRQRDLIARVQAMTTRGEILLGKSPSSFDEETTLIFGVTAPHRSEQHFSELTAILDQLFPGEGELAERLEAFRDQFVIPRDRLEVVMGAAIAECRRRTLEWVSLPDNEAVTLNITRDKPWVGFTEFRGEPQSIVHINQDVPVHIERAVELGCHEGYPGHHVHATLLEQNLVKQSHWVEYQFIQLIGPLAVVAEGAASYAPELVFTRTEQMKFERDVLFPLAGLDSNHLALYYNYIDLIRALNFARNEVARQYLYGGMPREQAVEWLMKYGLETRGTAEQRLNFIEVLRGYVITYNFGTELVSAYIEEESTRSSRWQRFIEMLATPLSPGDIER